MIATKPKTQTLQTDGKPCAGCGRRMAWGERVVRRTRYRPAGKMRRQVYETIGVVCCGKGKVMG